MKMFANKSNTAKVGALVAVLVMCAAALAGSAYAYTATYVDTIDDQTIENVFVTINDVQDTVYGDTNNLELDVIYDTLNTIVGADDNKKTYYVMSDAKSSNVAFAASVSDDGLTATFAGVIDTIQLKSYGDDSTGTVTVTGLVAAGTIAGVSKITYQFYNGSTASGTAVVSTTSDAVTLTSGTVDIATSAPVTLTVKATIEVQTLKSDDVMYFHANSTDKDTVISTTKTLDSVDGVAYYAPNAPATEGILTDITVDGTLVKYVFTSA